MSKKAPAPSELDTLESGPAVAVAVEEAPKPKPKMEMAALPVSIPSPMAGSVPASPVPGTFAPAPVVNLPEVQTKHYLDVFERMRPREAGPEHPGVWLNPDGTPYTPRQREGGQFSVLHVEFQNKWRPDMKRVAVMPLTALNDGEYGAQPTETIISRTEVKFDFQDQMMECLAAFGKKHDPLADHLQKRLREQGVAGGQGFDTPLKYASR